jgi:hypothetical protein
MTQSKMPPKLHYGRLHKDESAIWRRLAADIPAGTTLDTILQPGYWAHYVREIEPTNIITAFCEDGSWEAELRVMYVDKVGAKVAVRWHVEYDTKEVAVDDAEAFANKVKWISPGAKFAVVGPTGEVIKAGFYPRQQAINYLRQLG